MRTQMRKRERYIQHQYTLLSQTQSRSIIMTISSVTMTVTLPGSNASLRSKIFLVSFYFAPVYFWEEMKLLVARYP